MNFYPTKILSFLSFFVLLNLQFNLSANTKKAVSGQVKDKNSSQNLEFCTVRIYSGTDSLVLGTITDEKGYFTFNIEDGNYKMIVDYIGYQSDTSQINIDTKSTFLGIVELSPSAEKIGETVVKGKTKEIKIDKDELLVTSQLRMGAANTDDVLNKVKGVTLDRYNNTLKVDGNDNIIILVNGLEKDQEYIRNLSPKRLDKIEIIRDPSGRYALEGYSAIINIKLKNNYKGSEIYIKDQTLIDSDVPDLINLVPTNDFSATYNYTYNKVNFYLKTDNNYNNFYIPYYIEKEYNNGLIIKSGPKKGDYNNLSLNLFSNDYTLGFDYYLNPKHTLSFEGNMSDMPFNPQVTKQTFNNEEITQPGISSTYTSGTINQNRQKNSSNTIYYIGILNNKNTINADFTYSNYNEDYTNEYYENELVQKLEKGINEKDYTKFNVELNHEFGKKTNMQIGYGNTWKTLNNKLTSNFSSLYFNDDESNTSLFSQTEWRHKFYTYFAWTANQKIGIKLGGAIEQSSPVINSNSRNYFIYMPHLDIKYSPLDLLSIKLKYRSSSIYPTIMQANPFTYIIDQQSVQTGNPYLNPAVIHKLSMRFDILSGLASIEPYYHFSNNYITSTGSLTDNIIEYSFANTGEYINKGIKGNLTIPFGKSVILQSSMDFFRSKILYNETVNTLNDYVLDEQFFYMNKKYNTVTGLIYQKNNIKNITAQGWENEDNDFWMLFVQQPLLNKKMNILIGYILPVEYGTSNLQGSYIKTDNYTSKQYADIGLLQNIFILQLSYRFNKGNSVKKTDKEIKREIEKSSKGLL